ncbi:hypothetical protein JHK84_056729 [Glycine max]|nr:hypothetical protein JHK86_056687 [Glycine max]KAG5075498.1 hypothetical protein JHK84_056729 [Glycine max]
MIQSGSVEAYYENGKQLKDGKGKSKICNLSRHGRDQFQERLDFKFSDFQALEHRRDGNSYVDEMSVCCSDDLDSISDVSDNTFSRTSGSSHWDHLENTYYRRELSSKIEEEMDNTTRELQDEIKYEKGLNCDLELKLKKQQ